MESTQGQVFSIKNFTQHIKNIQIKKETEQKRTEDISLFHETKEEIDRLKSTIDSSYDKSTIESAIYRLKAAELDFDRHLSQKRSSQVHN